MIGHEPLIARRRLELALIAYWSGSLRAWMGQADIGLKHVSDGPGTAQLHLIRARAAARLGDVDTVRRAIKDADQARDGAGADDAADVVCHAVVSPAAHHYQTGAALSDIPGAGQEAVAELERAIELYTAVAVPGRPDEHDHMNAHVDLAAAQLRTGDLEAARVAAGPVLALQCCQRISSLPLAFDRIQTELTSRQYRTSPQAKDFQMQIDEFCAHTIATHLHETFA